MGSGKINIEQFICDYYGNTAYTNGINEAGEQFFIQCKKIRGK